MTTPDAFESGIHAMRPARLLDESRTGDAERPVTEGDLTPSRIALASVNVAQPRVIGTRRGQPVLSAIGKQPAVVETLHLDWLNLEGDRQADRRVHGGPDKAVYAYPSEHLPRWNAELGVDPPFVAGSFGENLTTVGLFEDTVSVGDVWAWGDALLQVTQPRSPCFKLAMITGRPDLLKRFVETGRSGWYLRVLRPGTVPVAGPMTIVDQLPGALSILAANGGSVERLRNEERVAKPQCGQPTRSGGVNAGPVRA